jgi:hypothetical protein
VTICLQSVTQTWLHDSFTTLNLRQQPMHVGHDLIIDFAKVLGNNATQQQTAKSWRMFNWQIQRTDRQSSRRRKRPSVPNLYFSKHIASNHDFRD